MISNFVIDFNQISNAVFTEFFKATDRAGQITLARCIGDCGLNPHQSQLARSLAEQSTDQDVQTVLKASAEQIDQMMLEMEE